MSKLIKAVWGGDKPFAIFLTDGTKINIGGNKQGCWLQIGKAAKIVQHETNPDNDAICLKCGESAEHTGRLRTG